MAQVQAVVQVAPLKLKIKVKRKPLPFDKGLSAADAVGLVPTDVLLSGQDLYAAVGGFLQTGLTGLGADARLLPSLAELQLPTPAELQAAAERLQAPQQQLEQPPVAVRHAGSKRPTDEASQPAAAAAKRQRQARPSATEVPAVASPNRGQVVQQQQQQQQQQRSASDLGSKQSGRSVASRGHKQTAPNAVAAAGGGDSRQGSQQGPQPPLNQQRQQQPQQVAPQQQPAAQPQEAAPLVGATTPQQQQKQQQQQQAVSEGQVPAAAATAEAHSSEQAAASRDTSAAAAAAALAAVGAAARSRGGGSASGAASAAAAGFTLLEVPPGELTPAAAALSTVVVAAAAGGAGQGPETLPTTGEAGHQYIQQMVEEARQLKRKADKRFQEHRYWDVFALCLYAQAAVKFMECMDSHERIWAYFQRAQVPPGPLQHPAYSQLYKQTASLCHTAKDLISNARGPDMAKQALRLLMERLYIICLQRHHRSKQHQLLDSARRIKSAVHTSSSSSNNGALAAAVAAPRAQRNTTTSPLAAVGDAAAQLVSLAAAGGGGLESKPLKKGSEGSSAQDTTSMLKLPSGRPANGSTQTTGAAVNHADLSNVVDTLQDMLRMSDSIHSGVLRLQQFLERPEVMANAAAKQAALEVSVLALDGGMYSVPHVAHHARAAVTQIIRILQSSSAAERQAGGR